MKELYLIWNSYISKNIIILGKLIKDDDKYIFAYNIPGAKIAQNEGCVLPFKLDQSVYVSKQLFPFFKNRIMDTHRRSFQDYLENLGLKKYDDLKILEKTRGMSNGDNFQLITHDELEKLRENANTKQKK